MATNPKDQYDALASEYDSRWGSYVDRSVRATFDRLDLSDSASVLDLGCGTGALLALLRSRLAEESLVGVDVSLEMLAVARRRLGGSVRLVQARAECLPFSSASVDIVVSSSSFHYWAAPAVGLSEIRRILKPGGRLAITDWCDDYLVCKVCDLLLKVTDPGHPGCYGTRDCSRLLLNAGFENVVVEKYKISLVWGLMTGHGTVPSG